MKKTALLTLALACLAPLPALAQGGGGQDPLATYLDEGRDPVPFWITCTSTSWTVVVTSDTAKRAAILQAPPDNDTNICISSATAGTCVGTMGGVELAANDSLTDNGRSLWRCRARANTAATMTTNIKGVIWRDRSDYGRIGRP